jgi:hypothetical protein
VLGKAAAGEAGEAGTVPISGEGEVPKAGVFGELLPRTLGDYQLLERIEEQKHRLEA